MGKRVNTAQWMEKQKRWQIKVQKDNERKTFYSSKPGRTGQREANAKADAWLDEGISRHSERIKDLYDAYFQEQQRTTSRANWHKAESIGKVWILPAIGNKKISAVNEGHLQNILNKATEKGLAKKSVSNIKSIILSFYKFCRKNKFTTLHPEFLAVPNKAKRSNKQILQPTSLAILFSNENTKYRDKIVFDKYIYAYRLQVLTGLRPGELIGLLPKDINGNIIRVQRSINDYGDVTEGKNQNAKRSFVLSSQAQQVVSQQLEIRDPNGDETLFQIRNQDHYRSCWGRYCEHNGIPYITPYELRHTFVSIAKKLSEGQIQPIVGHSKDMDTFGTYGHTLVGELEQTAEQLSNIFQEIFDNL